MSVIGHLAYFAAALSAVLGPFWMPSPDERGWRVAVVVAWALAAWAVFLWHAPTFTSPPSPRDRGEGEEGAGDE